VLPGISTEQLRSRLNRMVADGMLTRKRYREVPPRVDYELTERAQQLMPILRELARWGYEWAWSGPRSSERVDIGAIFRLGAGLVGPSGITGTVQCTITDGREDGPAVYTFSLSREGVSVNERTADNADARVSGDTAAWVRAFSPGQDRSGLHIDGNHQLIDAVISGLAPRAESAEHAAEVA
jgi:hypothetical protein